MTSRQTRPSTPTETLSPPGYRTRPPRTVPRDVVQCVWTATVPAALPPLRIVPDGCVDLIADGRNAWVAGPDTGPAITRLAPGTTLVGVRFRPGAAAAFLGVPAAALRDQRVALADLWPRDADRIAEQMRPGSGNRAAGRRPPGAQPESAGALLEGIVAERLATGASPDGAVTKVVQLLAAPPPGTAPPSVAELARTLGLSERQLLRRCTAAVGYGPTVLARVLRFRRFLAIAQGTRRGLAELAAQAGYADQAHLTHETRRLSGLPPSVLLSVPAVEADGSSMSDPDKTATGRLPQPVGP